MNTESLKKWVKALLFVFLFCTIWLGYLYIRRGSVSLSTINKMLGAGAVFFAAYTILLGPLSKRVPFFTRHMTIRRQLGLLALALAIVHVAISVFFLPQRFPLSWYQQEILPISAGIIAVLIWFYLAFISRNEKIKQMGPDKWKIALRLGANIAFIFIFFHILFLKFSDWTTWFAGTQKPTSYLKNPNLPPESLIIFLAMLAVIIYRVINNYFYHKTKNV